MNQKKCPFCSNIPCIKNGFQNNIQRWICKNCKLSFQSNNKETPSKEFLYCLYVFSKQSLDELYQSYHIGTKILQALFNTICIPIKSHKPREVHLSIDASYFGKLCVVAFRDFYTKENLWWKFCSVEKLEHYKEGKEHLERMGYVFYSVTADGFPGIPLLFKGIPFQFCHFHAKRSIIKYTTRKPKSIAGRELLTIMEQLHMYDFESFNKEIDLWVNRNQDFLQEKTVLPLEDRSFYTHKNLLSALSGIKRMSPYLFTYQSNRRIPRTTNIIEGHWKHVKIRVSVHCGLSLKRKQKLIELIMLNSSVTYKKEMEKKLFYPLF